MLQKDNKCYLIEYFLPFYYLLSFYSGYFYIGIGNAILLFIGLAQFNLRRVFVFEQKRKSILFFYLFIACKDVFRAIMWGSFTPLNNMLEYTLLFIAVSLVTNHCFDEDRLYKSWKVAGFIYSLGVLYHLFKLYVLGTNVYPISIFPGFQLGNGIASTRPVSFFPEPAACASALLPLIFLAIRRKDYVVALVYSFVVISTTSTVGIILVGVLWIYGIVFSNIKLQTKIMLTIIIIALCSSISSLTFINDGVEKLVGVSNGEGTFGSRIKVGADLISSMNVPELIFGTHYSNVYNFIENHSLSKSSVVMVYYNAENVFLNGFSYLMLHYGIIGTILYLKIVISRLRDKGYVAKGLLVMHLVSMVGQSTILNSLFFQVFILYLLYDSYQNNEEDVDYGGLRIGKGTQL